MEEMFQKILQAIPGYQGYRAEEARRNADHTLRMNLARQFTTERKQLNNLTQKALQAQKYQHLTRIDELGKKLDHFIARLESAPRGYAGWFSDVNIDEADLVQIYEFDARMVDSVPLLREHIAHVEKELQTNDNLDEALNALQTFIAGLHTQFDARVEFTLQGKRPTG
jgi:hypothetical protein